MALSGGMGLSKQARKTLALLHKAGQRRGIKMRKNRVFKYFQL
jgi:hypothetical protein